MARPRAISDEEIRQWILADESLYQRAREFGGGGDDRMYARLPAFIRKHRQELREIIRKKLEG